MVKIKFAFLLAILTISTGINAQSILNPQSKTLPGVMSPEDFGKRVNTLGKQTQEQLKQQVNSELKKPSPPMLGTPPASTPAAPVQQQAPAQNNQTPSAAQTQTDGNKIDPNIPAESPLQPQTQQPPASGDLPASSSGSPSSVYVPPADSTQTGPYTGFGGGNTNNKAPAGQQPQGNTSGGGLNIRY